ncbi:MAG: EamA family transporter [Eubacteriales bacterium]|nr:EamA family transporter [Eubacteriales bacterium]
MTVKTNKTTYLLIASVPIIWGLTPTVMKTAFDYISPFFMSFLRLTVAFVTSYFFLSIRGKLSIKDIPGLFRKNLLIIIFFNLFQIFYALGVRILPVGIIGIVFGLLPVTVLMINSATGNEKASLRLIISVAMSLLGVIIITTAGNATGYDNIPIQGILYVFIAQLSYGLFTINSKKNVQSFDPIAITTVATIPTSIIFFLWSFEEAINFNFSTLPFQVWMSIFFTGAIAVSFANSLWIWGADQIGSNRASLYSNLNPVVALIGGFFVHNELLNTVQLIGIFIIFIAIILSQVKTKALQIS